MFPATIWLSVTWAYTWKGIFVYCLTCFIDNVLGTEFFSHCSQVLKVLKSSFELNRRKNSFFFSTTYLHEESILDFAITFLWESCLHFEMTYLQAYRLSTDTAISPGNQISSPHTRSLSTCTVITPNWIENRVNIEVCFQILKDNRKVFKSIRVLQPLSQSFGAILRNRSYFSKFKVSCTCHHYAG